jgi:DNA-binding response OmpR family regulator/signal transduction histidine kinase
MSQDEALQILSIDDQTEVSKAIQQYFEANGHSVDTASDGVEGLEMASRTSYDVVLLDLLMPKMDGMKFCRRIRSNAKNAEVGIIVLTAVHDIDTRLTMLRAGVDDYLTKPFSFQELDLRVALQARVTSHRRGLQQSLRGEQRKASNLEIVAEVTRHITGLIDHNQTQVCETTVRMVVDRFGYEVVSIYTIEHDREHAVLYATEGAFADKKAIGHLYPLDKGVMGFVCRSGQSYLADDVRSDPYWVDNPLDQKKSEQIRSVISAPLKFADKTLGCMHIESTRIAAFEESDRLMLETLTGHLAVTLDNARLYQAMDNRTTDLSVHTGILEALNATRDLDVLFKTFALQISHIVSYTGFSVSRYDAEQQTVTYIYVDTPDEALYSGATFAASDSPYTLEVCQHGEAIIIPEVMDKSLSPDFRSRLQQVGIRSGLLAPIKYHDEILGILILSHKDVGNYNEQDVKRIQPLLPHFALAIKQAEEYQALQQAYADLQTAQENILQSERKKTAIDTAEQTGLTLSHEINNPLTAIIGFAELLNRDHPDNSEYQIILEAGQRIAEVVRRLRQLKSVELKSYVSDIPIQMIDLDIPVGKEK